MRRGRAAADHRPSTATFTKPTTARRGRLRCGAEHPQIRTAPPLALPHLGSGIASIGQALEEPVETKTSRTRDTDAALFQRALIAASSRTDDIADDVRRLAALTHNGLDAFDEPTVRVVVRQAVRDVCIAPP
ncbi:hypothetical protein [Streptomyces sp. NPDC059788]|uniref:hypothetical protein n=1 Tax=Streptomyces sp. NPDC059788 TaxID=3346948 RepID=UPI00366422F6